MSASARTVPWAFIGDDDMYGYPDPYAGQMSFDIGPDAPTDFRTVMRYVATGRGNPAVGNQNPPQYIGLETVHFHYRDRDDVTPQTKGVGYAASFSIALTTPRGGDVPWADVCCATYMNRSGAVNKGTDTLYFAHNPIFGNASEFGQLFSSDMNVDRLMAIGGYLNDCAMDFGAAHIPTGDFIRMPNATYIKAKSVDGATLRQLIGATIDDSVQIGAGWARIDLNAAVNLLGGADVWGPLRTYYGNFGTTYGNVTAATYTVGVSDNNLTFNAPVCTVTLPSATGANAFRELWLRSVTANAVNSASANVVQIAGGSLSTPLLPARAGAWCKLVSDSLYWQIQAQG
jgi:hypothetical protein